MPRRRCRKKDKNVELNLAAMLDMAFQLLTFFILTFKPAPIEGQLEMRMPEPVMADGKVPGDDPIKDRPPVIANLNSLTVSIVSTDTGEISALEIGEGRVATLAQLDARLRAALLDPTSTFDQVILQVGSALHYEQLMSVIDICTRQTLADGRPLGKLSFVELPGAGP